MHSAYCGLHTAHCRLHSAHSTVFTAQYILYDSQGTLPTVNCILINFSTVVSLWLVSGRVVKRVVTSDWTLPSILNRYEVHLKKKLKKILPKCKKCQSKITMKRLKNIYRYYNIKSVSFLSGGTLIMLSIIHRVKLPWLFP